MTDVRVMQDPAVARRLRDELQSFQDLWKGGYHEGDPRDPMGRSSYASLGYMSVLHATYLLCIRPYVGPDTAVVEIGPGRGAWTRTFLQLGATDVWCLDALSREHNGFDAYVGAPNPVRYFQVADFSCRELPDDHFNFLFSFGCLCHVSPDGVEQYLRNMYAKLRRGANAFILVADYDKYNAALADERLRLTRALAFEPTSAARRAWNHLVDAIVRRRYPQADWAAKDKREDHTPRPGRFFHMGLRETCRILEDAGYRVVTEDVGTNYLNPIVHFVKP